MNEYIAKIEGHGNLKIDFQKNKAELHIEEGERLFEGILIGRNYHEAPFITSRICGICPIAHHLASILAIEKAFGIVNNETTENLRKLLLSAQIIQSHNLHLFFLALPDYLGYDSGLEIIKESPAEFHLSLNIKRAMDEIITIVGGRLVHPINPIIGGFAKLPTKNQLAKVRNLLEETIDEVQDVVKLFANLEYPKLNRRTEYLALINKNEYAIYNGQIGSTKTKPFSVKEYKTQIKEIIKPYSTAKFGLKNKHGFMVGALARINLKYRYLNPLSLKILRKLGLELPLNNPFYNNFAQSLEMLHFYEEALIITNKLLEMDLNPRKTPLKIKPGEGIGTVEAPRGILIHHYKIDENGKITECNIITPTVCNLTNIEEDANELLRITKKLSQTKRKKLLEMLVRAYDPCLTCSVH